MDLSDNNVCTTDACDPLTGVSHTPISVDDDNVCTTDACDPVTGPSHTPISVDDNNVCTTDTCDPVTGPSHTPVDLSDNNLCTTDTCDPITGLAHAPVVFNDDNPCTDDSCDPSTGAPVYLDDNSNACTDGSLCTTDACVDGACVPTTNPIVSDDNPCTDDTCDPANGAAIYTNDNSNLCDNGTCQAGGCSCATGYENLTATACVDINACLDHPCDTFATCTDRAAPLGNTTAGRTCACNENYEGDGELLRCALINPCPTVTRKVIITGVIDGGRSGGLPKAVELFVTQDVADLSVYALGIANNGLAGGVPEIQLPSIPATAGTRFVVAQESPDFAAYFGVAPDQTHGGLTINGDDVIELFENTTLIDSFGVVLVDGTGQPWDYEDGWAYRRNRTDAAADGAFVLADWAFSQPDALDACPTTNAACAKAFPFKTFIKGTPPCGAGSCVDDSAGEYHCACPSGQFDDGDTCATCAEVDTAPAWSPAPRPPPRCARAARPAMSRSAASATTSTSVSPRPTCAERTPTASTPSAPARRRWATSASATPTSVVTRTVSTSMAAASRSARSPSCLARCPTNKSRASSTTRRPHSEPSSWAGSAARARPTGTPACRGRQQPERSLPH